MVARLIGSPTREPCAPVAARRARRLGALLLFQLDFIDHVVAQVVVGQAEFLPPVGQHLVDLADFGAQAHEVKGGAKARLLDQAKRRAAHALLEARLHHPDLAHVAGQLAAARHVANAGVEHVVDRILQRRDGECWRSLMRAAQPSRTSAHSTQASRKLGRHRLALAHAAVGVLQRGVARRVDSARSTTTSSSG